MKPDRDKSYRRKPPGQEAVRVRLAVGSGDRETASHAVDVARRAHAGRARAAMPDATGLTIRSKKLPCWEGLSVDPARRRHWAVATCRVAATARRRPERATLNLASTGCRAPLRDRAALWRLLSHQMAKPHMTAEQDHRRHHNNNHGHVITSRSSRRWYIQIEAPEQ